MTRRSAAAALLAAALSLAGCSERQGNAQTPSAPPAVATPTGT